MAERPGWTGRAKASSRTDAKAVGGTGARPEGGDLPTEGGEAGTIPKKPPGKFRPLGIPGYGTGWRRFGDAGVGPSRSGPQPEQYGYRTRQCQSNGPPRARTLQRGRHEVVDGESNYFGEIPHAELIRSIAREQLIKAWLEMPVEDRRGGCAAGAEPWSEAPVAQGFPISPMLSQSLHEALHTAGVCFCARSNYGDDFCVPARTAMEMLEAVKRIMEELKLPVNERKTRCRCPEEALEFLGYRIGRTIAQRGGRATSGPDPARRALGASAARSASAAPRNGIPADGTTSGLGQVSPAYRAIDCHAVRRLRQWLCRRQGEVRGDSALPDERLAGPLLAGQGPRAFRGRRSD